MEFHVSNGRIQSNNPISSECRARNNTRLGATIQFEVAPDPDNRTLAARWRRLPEDHKREITRAVAEAVVPQALAALKVKGDLIEQTGGYLGETNPSLAVRLTCGKRGIEVARFLGHVFAQQSVMVVSESRRKGLNGVDVISIRLPDDYSVRQIANLYDRLWSLRLNGKRPVTGHTTAGGQMSIMNFSGIETEALKARIDELLKGAFATKVRRDHVGFIGKGGYGHDVGRQIWPVVPGGSAAFEWHDYLRWKVATVLRAAFVDFESGKVGRLHWVQWRAA